MSLYRHLPALFLLAASGMLAAPARAHHEDTQGPAAAAADDQLAPHAEAATPDEALPTNELTASTGSNISAVGVNPSGSLHTSPKVMNNVGLSNDMKSALKAAKPSTLPEKPPIGAIAKPAAREPAPSAPSPVAPSNDAAYELQIGSPDTPANALPGAEAPTIASSSRASGPLASDPLASGPLASGPTAPRPGAPLPALIGVGALALAAGFLLARMMRKPSQS